MRCNWITFMIRHCHNRVRINVTEEAIRVQLSGVIVFLLDVSPDLACDWSAACRTANHAHPASPPAPYTRCAIYVRQAHYAFALCGWNISLLLPLKYNFKYIRDNKLRRRLTLLIRTNPRRLFFLKVGASQVSTTLIFGCLEAESSRTWRWCGLQVPFHTLVK